jgi:hypothetical protein
VYQKFLEIDVSSTSRLRGVFSENREILPHSMERQRLKIYEKNFCYTTLDQTESLEFGFMERI